MMAMFLIFSSTNCGNSLQTAFFAGKIANSNFLFYHSKQGIARHFGILIHKIEKNSDKQTWSMIQ